MDEQLASYDEIDLFVLTLYEDVSYNAEHRNFFPVIFIADESRFDLDAICLDGAQCCKRLEDWLQELYGVRAYCDSHVKVADLFGSVTSRCPDWKDRAIKYLEQVKAEAINDADS